MDWIGLGKLLLTLFSGGLAGAFLNQWFAHQLNRLQKMHCHYMDDDVQSKLPVNIDDKPYRNVHLKTFDVINTTNRDIQKFAIRFVFDLKAVIIDYSSHTKAGTSITKVRTNRKKRVYMNFSG